jgi:hypothetical protein
MSPTLAVEVDEIPEPVGPVRSGHKRRKTTNTTRRSLVATLINMHEVMPRSIAYIAIQVYF